ncbi:MAG: malonate decarboxylase holo-[acyl-carrier-protein] synthase [Gallionella sp.]
MSNEKISRHALVWLREAGHAALIAQVTDGTRREFVRAWLAADRPLVVSRQPEEISSGMIAVGLALPPSLAKCRIALKLPRADIAKFAPPLQLTDVISNAPTEWRNALEKLAHAAKNIGIALRVYGSFSWQTMSGLSYVTTTSDIDLLWQARSPAQLQQGISLLLEWEQTSGLRADGEVLFGDDHAVSWREWSQTKSVNVQRVLVKRDHSAALLGTHELLEFLA